jgi:hypothetical protein
VDVYNKPAEAKPKFEIKTKGQKGDRRGECEPLRVKVSLGGRRKEGVRGEREGSLSAIARGAGFRIGSYSESWFVRG